jgi:hypothetical protein
MAQFHWVGSTAASIDSFKWDNINNWKILELGKAGSTAPNGSLARLVSANRLPRGNDTIHFGPQMTENTQYSVGLYHIYSPCLFGGITTDTGATFGGLWSGSTGASTNLFGAAWTYVYPGYKFSRLGGYIDLAILNEWRDALSAYGYDVTAFTLASGTEFVDAEYTSSNWFGYTAGVGISFASQSIYDVRLRGSVYCANEARTTVTVRGFTAQNGGHNDQNYDGSLNTLTFSPIEQRKFTVTPNTTGNGYTGTSFETPTNSSYSGGSVVVRGHWNRVVSPIARKNGKITFEGAIVNHVNLVPSSQLVYVDTANDPNVVPVTPTTTNFDSDGIIFDNSSNARNFQVSNMRQFNTNAQFILHGDCTPTSGFVCLAPAGACAGAAGGVSVPIGSIEITPPLQVASGTVNRIPVAIGFPGNDGSPKVTTTISNLYSYIGNESATNELIIEGALENDNIYLYGGVLKNSTNLPNSAEVTIDNLSLYQDASFDSSVNPNHRNFTVVVRPQSNSTIVNPGQGTVLTLTHVEA